MLSERLMRRLYDRLQSGEVSFEPTPFGDAVRRPDVEPSESSHTASEHL